MGFLIEKFKNVSKKAVLTTALATTLVAGTGSAFAQTPQAGPPPTPQGQTEQVRIPQKPWENDPAYVRLVQNYDAQLQARQKQYAAQEKAQLANCDANYQVQQANVMANADAYRRQGLPGIIRLGALESQINTQHQQCRTTIKSNYDALDAREEAARENYILVVDNQFAAKPEYKARVTQAAPTTQPAAVKRGVSLSPEEQHDRLVRAYQDAQLQSAQSGGRIPMPDPAKYGLDPKDPAIQPKPPR